MTANWHVKYYSLPMGKKTTGTELLPIEYLIMSRITVAVLTESSHDNTTSLLRYLNDFLMGKLMWWLRSSSNWLDNNGHYEQRGPFKVSRPSHCKPQTKGYRTLFLFSSFFSSYPVADNNVNKLLLDFYTLHLAYWLMEEFKRLVPAPSHLTH